MKKILIFLIALFVSNNTFSQDFTVEVGPSFAKANKKDVYKIVFPTAYGFTTLHHLDNVMLDNNKTMTLTKYDQTMQAIETIDFNLPKLGLRAADLQEVIELENQLVFLSTVMDKKSKKHQVNAQVYNNNDNSVTEHKVLASFAIEGYSKSGYFQLAISPDKSKIAIVANMPFKKKTQEQVEVWVYDNQLNLVWNQKETLNYKSERAYQEQVFVLNSGEVLMNKLSNAFKKTRKAELITFNGTSASTSDFSSLGFQPMDMKLIDANGKPMLVGFFWDGKKVMLKINSKEGDETNGAFLFDLTTKNLIGIHNWDEKVKPNELKSLKVIDVEVINNDIYMIGEKQLTASEFKKTGSSMSMEMDYTHTFGASVIVNMDTRGTLKGFKPFMNSKKYINEAKEKGSLASVYLNNGLRLFANNNYISLYTYFKDGKATFRTPTVRPKGAISDSTPYIIPSTVKAVKDYNLVYFISTYADEYWFNRMSW